MLIDWFTVGAQTLNFLILVWLMKRFLYKPILLAIDEREKRIAAVLADAEAKKTEAHEARDEFQHKNDAFDQQRAVLLSQATDAAHAERKRLFDEARQAAAELSSKRQEALRIEELNLHQAMTSRIQQEVFAIARQALTDLAGTGLEERMVEVFVNRLHELKDDQKVQLLAALQGSAGPVLVRSQFDLPPAQAASTECAIKEMLGKETRVQFETVPGLISGIELTANGQKVAWTIESYLSSLEKGIGELLNKPAGPEPSTENKNAPKPSPKAKASQLEAQPDTVGAASR